MSLSPKEVKNVAHLARLKIAENDIPQYAQTLSRILDLINKMNEYDTASIEPLAHPLDAKQRLREDVVTEINQRELMQKGAPATEAGLYLVPEVIEKEE